MFNLFNKEKVNKEKGIRIISHGNTNREITDGFLKEVNSIGSSFTYDVETKTNQTCPECKTFDPRPPIRYVKDGSSKSYSKMNCSVCSCEWDFDN